jgi:hypothetical protein
MQVTNVGQTPARQLVVNIAIVKVNALEEARLEFKGQAKSANILGLLVPNQLPEPWKAFMLTDDQSNPDNPPLLTGEDLASFKSGQIYFVVFAKATFVDINDKPHWVQYCARVALGDAMAQNCTKYNDTDQD